MQSRQDLQRTFQKMGRLPARKLLDDDALEHLQSLRLDTPRERQGNAAKALWQVDEATLNIATSDPIVETLDILFRGNGYYLWGAQLVDRAPGEIHPWHRDIETAGSGFVSIWIGIDGANEKTSLSVIDGSHLFPNPIQAHWPRSHSARLDPAAKEIVMHPEVLDVPGPTVAACGNGDGVFFDGRLWHGSFNLSDKPRKALLLQYGEHDAPVRHPASFDAYPFEYHSTNVPLTMPVRGAANPVANKTIERRPDGKLGFPAARICARPNLMEGDGLSWMSHPYFQVETPIMSHFTCHASVLCAGYMPHTQHEHREEEVLVVLSGEAAIFAAADSSGALRIDKAGPGDAFYYPVGMPHTIANLSSSGEPLHYVMFKWAARSGRVRKVPGFKIPASAYEGDKRVSIDRPSSGLDKLHVHSSRLQPGQTFPKHIDRYDSAILVLTGELSVLDQTLGPGGVFLTRAGELHDTHNASIAPCSYLVFEFHAMAS